MIPQPSPTGFSPYPSNRTSLNYTQGSFQRAPPANLAPTYTTPTYATQQSSFQHNGSLPSYYSTQQNRLPLQTTVVPQSSFQQVSYQQPQVYAPPTQYIAQSNIQYAAPAVYAQPQVVYAQPQAAVITEEIAVPDTIVREPIIEKRVVYIEEQAPQQQYVESRVSRRSDMR